MYVLILRFGISNRYNIKDNTGYYQLLLYIKCVSVLCEYLVSFHGAGMDLNSEYLGILFASCCLY